MNIQITAKNMVVTPAITNRIVKKTQTTPRSAIKTALQRMENEP